MGAEEKIAVLRTIFDDFAATGSVDSLIDSLTDDVVYRVTVGPGTPLSGDFVGKDGVRAYFAGMPEAVEHLSFAVHDFLANDDTAVVTGHEGLKVTKTGVEFESEWAVVCKYRGDLISSVVVIENLAPLEAAYS